MWTFEGTTVHPRCCLKERKFNGANLSKPKWACSQHRYMLRPTECLWIVLESRRINVHSIS